MYQQKHIHTKRINNILIIEDLPSWQNKFRRFLRDEPFNIAVAANYLEAMFLAELYIFDLVILDVNLSGVPYNVDGLRIADKLWGNGKRVKIIIVSGDKNWDGRLGIYGFNPNFVLEKQSLDQDDFVQKIHQTLGV